MILQAAHKSCRCANRSFLPWAISICRVRGSVAQATPIPIRPIKERISYEPGSLRVLRFPIQDECDGRSSRGDVCRWSGLSPEQAKGRTIDKRPLCCYVHHTYPELEIEAREVSRVRMKFSP